MALVQRVASLVRLLASLLLDFNNKFLLSAKASHGTLLVECMGASIEELAGSPVTRAGQQGNETSSRKATLHYLSNEQLHCYLEQYCMDTCQTQSLTQVKQMVSESVRQLPSALGSQRVTPLVMVYKHSEDGHESFATTVLGVEAVTETAQEGAELLLKILNDAQMNRCQMIEVNLSSSEIIAFDADPRSFATLLVDDVAGQRAPNIAPEHPIGSTRRQVQAERNAQELKLFQETRKVKCKECGTPKSRDAFSTQQTRRPRTAHCIQCVEAASNRLMMDLPGCDPWTPRKREEAEAAFDGVPISAGMARDAEAVGYQQMIPAFYKEFMAVINSFAAAKFEAEGASA
eukprot:680848-Rhodomonas_salina.1